MNPINQTLFTARVTDDMPPKLSVDFGQGNPFTRRNAPCEEITVGGDKQCKINLGTQTVDVEAINTLASGGDYGKSLTLRQVSQSSYACDDEDEVSTTLGNVAQVILQIRNVSLMAEFSKGGTGPVSPMMPGTLPVRQQVPVVQTPGAVNAPAAVVPVIAAAPQPSVTPLRGDLPQETWSIRRLAGTSYDDYLWYKKHSNPPIDAQKKAAYDRQYPIFLKEEGLYAALQEKLTAAAHNKLTGCLPQSEVIGLTGSSERGILAAYNDYQWYVNNPHCPSDVREKYSYDTQYPIFLQKERNYLAQKARNEYNSAS